MSTQYCRMVVIQKYATAYDGHIRRRCRQLIQSEINSKPKTERKRLQRVMQHITKTTPLRYLKADLELLGISEKFECIKREALVRIKVRRVLVRFSEDSEPKRDKAFL